MLNILCSLIVLLYFYNVLSAAGSWSKIVNGAQAKKGEFQYVVSLQKENREHYCGGSLLTLSWILTACHCVWELNFGEHNYVTLSEIVAVGGSVDITTSGKNQVRGIKQVIKHPHCEFLEYGMTNDYGLCETIKPFEPGPYLNVMRAFSWIRGELSVRTDELIRNNFACQVVGWGVQNVSYTGYDIKNITYRHNTSKVLMKLKVNLSDHQKCNQDICTYYIKTTNESKCEADYVFSRGQVCAYGTNKGDACDADSGGPLSCNGFVYGIVSWGPYCGEKIGPNMYSRLDKTEFFNKIRDLALAKSTCSVIRSSTSIPSLFAISSFFRANIKA